MDEDFYMLTSNSGCCHVDDVIKTYEDCGGDFTTVYDQSCWSYYCPVPADCEGLGFAAKLCLIIFGCIIGGIIIITAIILAICYCCRRSHYRSLNKEAQKIDKMYEEQEALNQAVNQPDAPPLVIYQPTAEKPYLGEPVQQNSGKDV